MLTATLRCRYHYSAHWSSGGNCSHWQEAAKLEPKLRQLCPSDDAPDTPPHFRERESLDNATFRNLIKKLTPRDLNSSEKIKFNFLLNYPQGCRFLSCLCSWENNKSLKLSRRANVFDALGVLGPFARQQQRPWGQKSDRRGFSWPCSLFAHFLTISRDWGGRQRRSPVGANTRVPCKYLTWEWMALQGNTQAPRSGQWLQAPSLLAPFRLSETNLTCT